MKDLTNNLIPSAVDTPIQMQKHKIVTTMKNSDN